MPTKPIDLMCVGALTALLVGCSSPSSPPTGASGAAGSASGGQATGSAGAAGAGVAAGAGGSVGGGSGAGGAISGPSGAPMVTGAAGSAPVTAGVGGTGGAGTTCPTGTETSITQIMNGSVVLGTHVGLAGVVATSPKFLLSKGSTGTCQWALSVSDRLAQAVPYSGAIIMTSGAPAPAIAGGFGACPTGTDALPNDAVPGDVFDATVDVVKYVRADCAARTPPAPAPEVRLDNACAVTRTARGQQVPTPATVPDVTELTNVATEAVHRKWTGVLLQLGSVTSQRAVNATGSIQLTNGVRVRDRIYQPKVAAFPAGTSWTSIVGIGHLDVCTWSLEPRDPCTDFAPKSQGCP